MNDFRKALELIFYHPKGTMPPKAPSYLERRADRELYDCLRRGDYCYVLTSRQVGKSSLGAHTLARLRDNDNAAVAMFELTRIDRGTEEQWYFGILSSIGSTLRIRPEVEEFWIRNTRLGPLQRCMDALVEVVMARFSGPVVIVIDEIEEVRGLEFNTDGLFAAIRELYNRRSFEPDLNRLTFCLIGSALPSDLIRNPETTPFNIARRIELTDFSREEAQALAEGLGREQKVADSLLKRILHWTEGHPYLTQNLCLRVAGDSKIVDAGGVDKACKELFLYEGATDQDDNLRFVRNRLLGEKDRAGLLTLYSQVHAGKRVPNDPGNPLVDSLRLSGITRVEGGCLKVRNPIYHTVFNQVWARTNMPGAELRRQRAAARRAWQRALGVIALITALLIFALIQRSQAQKSASDARANADIAESAKQKAEEKAGEAEASAQKEAAQREIAEQNAVEAARQRRLALENARVAEQKTREAEIEKRRAEASAASELAQRQVAEQKTRQANESNSEAQKAKAEAITKTNELVTRNRELVDSNTRIQEARSIDESRALAAVADSELDKIAVPGLDGGDTGFKRGTLAALLSVSELSKTTDKVTREGLNAIERALPASQLERSFTGLEHVFSLAFRNGGKEIATAGLEGKVVLWGAESGVTNWLQAIVAPAEPITSVALSSDGTILGIGTDDGLISYYRIDSQGTVTGPYKATKHRHAINRITFGNLRQKGDTLLGSASSLWISAVTNLGSANKSEKGKRKWRKPGVFSWLKMVYGTSNTRLINAIAFSNDGEYLALGRQDGTTEIRGSKSGKLLLKLLGQRDVKQAENGFKANPRDPKLYKKLGCSVGVPCITDPHKEAILGVGFSPTDDRLVTLSRDKTAKVWDVSKAQMDKTDSTAVPEYTLEGHDDAVVAAAFNNDGSLIATASQDRTAIIWDVTVNPCKAQQANSSSRRLVRLPRHSSYINAIGFSPDGKYLATASASKTNLWNVSSASELRELRCLVEEINQNQGRFDFNGNDNTAIIPKEKVNDLLARILKVIPVDFTKDDCKSFPSLSTCEQLVDLQRAQKKRQ